MFELCFKYASNELPHSELPHPQVFLFGFAITNSSLPNSSTKSNVIWPIYNFPLN